MNTVKSNSKTKSKQYLLLVTVAGVILLLSLIWATAYTLNNTNINYAAEVAKPIEKALVEAGGVKKGSGGDAGVATDNTQPYYDATYDLTTSKEDAIVLVNKIAENNGYKLAHASPSNRGHLGAVADVYIDAWYFDTVKKPSPYPKLDQGPILLAFKFGDEDNSDQAGHTSVRISVQLPTHKRQ